MIVQIHLLGDTVGQRKRLNRSILDIHNESRLLMRPKQRLIEQGFGLLERVCNLFGLFSSFFEFRFCLLQYIFKGDFVLLGLFSFLKGRHGEGEKVRGTFLNEFRYYVACYHKEI